MLQCLPPTIAAQTAETLDSNCVHAASSPEIAAAMLGWLEGGTWATTHRCLGVYRDRICTTSTDLLRPHVPIRRYSYKQ
eukprot:719785-Rhodomonas_salina.3